MDEVNQKLLEEVVSLEFGIAKNSSGDDKTAAITAGYEGMDRLIQIQKIEEQAKEHADTHAIEQAKIELERERLEHDKNVLAQTEAAEKHELIMKSIELGATCILVPVGEAAFKWAFAKLCMAFDSETVFTSTPGRSISQMFKWRR